MTTTAADFTDFDKSLIRKWGSKILAVAPMSVAFPTAFFDAATYLPLAFPTGSFSLGAISTDGVKESVSIKTDEVVIDQSAQPARVDLSTKSSTLQVTFEEATAWTHALRSGIPLSQWPADKHAAFSIDEGDVSDFPFMRIFLIARDGVDTAAHYRVEGALKAQVSDLGDRQLSRNKEESFEVTFTLFQDDTDTKHRSYIKRQDGPGYATHLTEA